MRGVGLSIRERTCVDLSFTFCKQVLDPTIISQTVQFLSPVLAQMFCFLSTLPLCSLPPCPLITILYGMALDSAGGKKGHAQEVWRISCKVGRGALIRHVHWKTFASGNVKRVTAVTVLQGKTKKLWCTFQAHKTKSKEEAVNCGISFHNSFEARSENQHT